LPCLTPKDKKDIKWGVEHKVDYIALSFVGTAQDIHDARSELECGNNSTIPIIAKIERALALKDLDNIAAASDAMMVARGDLGLELPMERVPVAQRQIIARAGSAGIPVITATQMLLSMVTEVRPTRAEVSDVFTAVRDGTDAVMLSEETTIGHDPVAAVRMLSQILEEAEQELSCEHNWQLIRTPENARVADAVCIAACSAADKVSAAGIIACTLSGSTARLLSKYRPLQPLFAATPDPNTLPRMALYWGIEPILTSLGDNTNIEYEITEAMCHIRDHYGVKPGMKIVVTAGLRSGEKGGTNVMEVRLIPR
jgi:pyruvate kinase